MVRLAETRPRPTTPAPRSRGSAVVAAARPSSPPSLRGRTQERRAARRRARRSTGQWPPRAGSAAQQRASCLDRLSQTRQAPSYRCRRIPWRTARARASNAHGHSLAGGCPVRRICTWSLFSGWVVKTSEPRGLLPLQIGYRRTCESSRHGAGAAAFQTSEKLWHFDSLADQLTLIAALKMSERIVVMSDTAISDRDAIRSNLIPGRLKSVVVGPKMTISYAGLSSQALEPQFQTVTRFARTSFPDALNP